MAEYIRFVSYLYEYDGNERKKNAGFVRYEVRGGQKKLTVVVNAGKYSCSRADVYAFYRELDSCIGIKLGVLIMKNGRGSFQYGTYADGPGQEDPPECSFADVAGIVVCAPGEGCSYATIWDDLEFRAESFVKCRQDLVRPEPEPESEPESEPDPGPEPAPEPEPETAGKQTGAGDEKQKFPDSMPGFELRAQTLWDRLCKIYPKVMPFPYNAYMRAIRIRPQDLGRFPKDNWPLAKNSFMLHGFFQYKYILAVRIVPQSEQNRERYMVGVPGVYGQTEYMMADMFGFGEFFGSPRDRRDDGCFGFWMRELTVEK